ncbi:MAG: flagellar hook-associated protein FlgK [Agarilytica sp.]
MTGSLLGISISGLRVAQTSLNTTGHNISNAGVDGYSRQRVLSETNPATFREGGYVGNGTRVQSIERVANEFIETQLRFDTALFKDLEVYQANIDQLDSLLSDVSTGLSSGLESFFAAVQNGADDPTSIPARQLIVSETENLSDRFNSIYSRIEAIESNLNSELSSTVTEINSLTASVAELNRKVADALGTGALPNDLIDQRAETIRKLSELVSVQVIDESFGQVNIVVGGGQNLVIGNEARELDLSTSSDDARKLDIFFAGGREQSRQVITDLVSGGELGGLVRFRDSIMDTTYNELGRVAVVLAETFNTTHQQGVNLNNEFGGNFFYDVNNSDIAQNRVVGNANNAQPSDRILSLDIVESSELTASDYEVEMGRGGLFTITRLSDGEEVASSTLSGSFPFVAAFDGLELNFESGTFQEGDSFKLVPFRSGARDFSSGLINPEDIAFGSPLLTDTSLGNQGTGSITQGEVLSLLDQNNLPIPLLATPGEMNPPLLVHFTSPTTYDILDNSDPGNPVQLDPPIRNQNFVVGANNPLFGTDPGETLVSTSGDLVGLPEGRREVLSASIQLDALSAVPPDFTVADFSATSNQFGFDVVVTSTLSGANDGTFPVTISGGAITDEDALLQEINTQLSLTDVRAYIADNGSLAFRLDTPGYGDITINNFDDDPDGNGDAILAGVANNLLGFDIEGSTFTSIGGADGISGDGTTTNGYPAEAIAITIPAGMPGEVPVVENIFTNLNASARETASLLNNVSGVSANAFNYIELSNFQLTHGEPLQFNLNGQDLVEYGFDSVTGEQVLDSSVPNSQTDPEDFYDYLASRINENDTLSALGIHATGGIDAVTGAHELRIYEHRGNDLQVALTALSGDTIDVSDGSNPNLRLNATGNSTTTSVTVGGQIDITLADGITLETFPPNSMLFGDTTASSFSQSTYYGIQAALEGIPDQGDSFTLDFNVDAASDNRNALNMVGLESARIIGNGVASYSESYSALVEDIGIDTAASRINLDASDKVLNESVARRNSVSGVNLDEEAANLIRFEQLYSANAQVISVARDLFDRLISAF